VFTGIPIFGVRPDLILVLVVIFSLLNGGKFGAKFGFFAGLMLDLLVGQMIGLNAVTKMLIGASVGVLSERVFKENYFVPFICVFVATWIDQFLFLFGTVLFGETLYWNIAVTRVVLPMSLYNAVFVLLIYVRFYYLNDRIAYWDELVKRSG